MALRSRWRSFESSSDTSSPTHRSAHTAGGAFVMCGYFCGRCSRDAKYTSADWHRHWQRHPMKLDARLRCRQLGGTRAPLTEVQPDGSEVGVPLNPPDTTPVRFKPASFAPSKSVLERLAPLKSAPATNAPARFAPLKSASVAVGAMKDVFRRSASEKLAWV